MDRLHVATLNILQPGRPLVRAPAAAARRHGGPPAGPARAPGGRLRRCSRTGCIGAAGEGRYARGPRLGRPAGVRQQPAGARRRSAPTDVERLDLGLNRSAHRAVVGAPGGSTVAGRRDPPASRGRRRRASATTRPAALLELARRRSGRRRDGRRGRLQRRSRASPRPRGWRRPASGPPTPRRTAPSRRSPGRPASRRRRMDTDGDPDCLDYIWVRGAVAGRRRPARLRPAGRRAIRPSTRATTSGITAHLEIG